MAWRASHLLARPETLRTDLTTESKDAKSDEPQ